jgi:hypothetical protein
MELRNMVMLPAKEGKTDEQPHLEQAKVVFGGRFC